MDLDSKFRRYASWVADKCGLYADLAGAVAQDDSLLDIAREARPGQPEPELFLAAVHSLLLAGRDHQLQAYYPTCGGSADGDPIPPFREFCGAHEDALRRIVGTRRCQTNDVGRSGVLLPAFEHVSRVTDTDTVAQLELGTSAGLNLNWDRYHYEYPGLGAFGDDRSPVTIRTEVRGDTQPPLSQPFPTVHHRRGVDLNTLDVTNEADARWLHALVHPNQRRRHEQLDGAIETARAHPPNLLEGDAPEKLPDMLAEAPDDIPIVVFSTHVLYQLPEEMVAELRSVLSRHSSTQPVHWLSIDPDEDLGVPTYRWVEFTRETETESHLARFEPYGEWLEWKGT
jgi:hypothetical protein